MHSNSAFHNICAKLSSWKYHSLVSAPGETAGRTKPSIHIDAAILDDYPPLGLDIEKGLLLCLSVIDNTDSPMMPLFQPLPWELDLFPQDDDPYLPKHLSAELTVPEATIRDMKNCLFLTASSSGSVMQIKLIVQEKESTSDSISERTFSVSDFSYELIYQRIEV